MQKKELIYLHMLGVLLKREIRVRKKLSEEPFNTYHDCGVSSTEVQRRKECHQDALLTLLQCITAQCEPEAKPDLIV